MIKKPARVLMVDNAKESFSRLNEISGMQIKTGKTSSPEIQLLKSIKSKITLIKSNPFYGDNIKKNLIPKKYNVPNLWRVELSNYWRMLYTIRGDDIEIICFILKILNHEDYNKIFGYKKK